MIDTQNQRYRSTSLEITLLLLLFIGLKLTGHIAWSWWWVLSPLWIPIVLAVVCLLIYVILRFVVDDSMDRPLKPTKIPPPMPNNK